MLLDAIIGGPSSHVVERLEDSLRLLGETTVGRRVEDDEEQAYLTTALGNRQDSKQGVDP